MAVTGLKAGLMADAWGGTPTMFTQIMPPSTWVVTSRTIDPSAYDFSRLIPSFSIPSIDSVQTGIKEGLDDLLGNTSRSINDALVNTARNAGAGAARPFTNTVLPLALIIGVVLLAKK